MCRRSPLPPWKLDQQRKAFSNECWLSRAAPVQIARMGGLAGTGAQGHSQGVVRLGNVKLWRMSKQTAVESTFLGLQPRAQSHRCTLALSEGGLAWAEGQGQYLLVYCAPPPAASVFGQPCLPLPSISFKCTLGPTGPHRRVVTRLEPQGWG